MNTHLRLESRYSVSPNLDILFWCCTFQMLSAVSTSYLLAWRCCGTVDWKPIYFFIYFIDRCDSLTSYRFVSLTTCESLTKQKLIVDCQGTKQLTLAVIEKKTFKEKHSYFQWHFLGIFTVTLNLVVFLNCVFIYG